ncbi:MAG TPA: serine/threonine-protein kinase [Blastocatellia bacterium]|nr:serine/threonine-protein kinase [Blastocatellia bacterium]
MNTAATRQPAAIGPYRVVDVSGEGGMGRVYRAVHTTRHQVVAIKVLNQTAQDDKALARIINEARIHSGLHHPNIVRFYELLEWEGSPCLVMEYVEGYTLSDHLKKHGALPLAQALGIFEQTLEAVQYIHHHDIVHRDIKPHNLRITPDGRVKLLDFGIARADTTPKMTKTGMVVGTLEYLSPEQLRTGKGDHLSDIWALGILLYEMISGEVPFAANTFGTLYEKINKAAFTPPPELKRAVPREVLRLIHRCLKKQPEDRYQSVTDLLEDLRRVNSGAPPTRPITSLSPLIEHFRPLFQRFEESWREQLRGRRLPVLAACVLALVIGWWTLGSLLLNDPNVRSIRIETPDGPAELYQNDRYLGTTPYEIPARVGERLNFELRRDGLRKPVNIFVTDNKKVYAEPLR